MVSLSKLKLESASCGIERFVESHIFRAVCDTSNTSVARVSTTGAVWPPEEVCSWTQIEASFSRATKSEGKLSNSRGRVCVRIFV